MNEPPEVERGKRPASITITCIFYFIAYPLLFFYLWWSCDSYSFFLTQDLCFKRIHILFLDENVYFWMIALFVTVIGLWNMWKWAAYSYISIVTMDQIRKLASAEFSLRSLFIQGLVVYFILKHVSKMS